MKEAVEIIIREIKELAGGSMIFVFILSLFYFIFDFFIIRHYIQHTFFLDVVRTIFFILCLFSTIFLFDRLYKKILNVLKEKKQKEQKREQYETGIKNHYKKITPVLNSLSDNEKDILKTFAKNNIREIALINDFGVGNPVDIANGINCKLYALGLNILIGSTFTHVILTIDQAYLDILSLYFSDLN